MEDVKAEAKKEMRFDITKREGDIRTNISVEAIDNGFLITTNVCDSSDNKYKETTKKTFSKTNPLDEAEEENEDETSELSKGMAGLLDSLANVEGKINV